ncbi:rhodanese-like domain-containing protein [Chryseobacterium sp. A301]
MSTIQEVLTSGNYHLIDVREPIELEMDGAIEGATNIPLGEVEARAEEITSLPNPVILFCRSGNRSGKALELLYDHGLKEGYNGGGYIQLQALLEDQ